MVFLLYITTQEGLNTSNFNQASVVTIFQCIVNVTHTPVSTQSSGNMGNKLSQNREMVEAGVMTEGATHIALAKACLTFSTGI